jgi:hypothetical protein
VPGGRVFTIFTPIREVFHAAVFTGDCFRRKLCCLEKNFHGSLDFRMPICPDFVLFEEGKQKAVGVHALLARRHSLAVTVLLQVI